MKPWPIISAVLFITAAAAFYNWSVESDRASSLAGIVTKLETENAKLGHDLAEANNRAQAMAAESEQLRAAHAISGARLEPSAAPAPAAESSKKEGGGGSFMQKIFKDPNMRKMVAAQAAAALRGYYSEFLKEANLTPDEADKFFQILQDRQLALMDSSASVMSGSAIDPTAISAATDTANDAVKSLLGDGRFKLYQDFEKTLGNRIMVQQFNQQLSAGGTPLQDYQTQSLIQIMSEEQASMPNLSSPDGSSMQTVMNMTPDQVDQYSKQIDAVNQRVYNRAISVLNPAQLSAFATFQKNMAVAQVAGLKMSQQMFKGGQ